MSILVIDVGTSSVRAAIVRPDGGVEHEHRLPTPPASPFPGLVEFDPERIWEAALACSQRALHDAGRVDAVGIANQRASTLVWDRVSGEPVGPGLGWQDLRTAGTCLVLQADGIRLAPNESATKLQWLLDTFDADRTKDLCFGTLDSWLVWKLTGGEHVTDRTNAGVTGLLTPDATAWRDDFLDALRIPTRVLPTVVDSIGEIAPARALDGAPLITGLVGDQQASLIGQGCVRAGRAKITFGTGGMLDVCLAERPSFERRGEAGTFPIVAWQKEGAITWGLEAIMLSAGANVDWLRDDLGVLERSADSDALAASCKTTEGVVYVPALLGLGCPHWDFGARGTLLGITRGTTRAHLARAVLEGVAHRGIDLVEAAERDGALTITSLRIDGGMSANDTFTQALADAGQRPVEIAPIVEATALGAAYVAGLAVGTWKGLDDIEACWRPRRIVEPLTAGTGASTGDVSGGTDRATWGRAVERARSWIPELSALDF